MAIVRNIFSQPIEACPSAAATTVARFEKHYKKWWDSLYVGKVIGASLILGEKARRNLLIDSEYAGLDTAEKRYAYLTKHATDHPTSTTAKILAEIRTFDQKIIQPAAASART